MRRKFHESLSYDKEKATYVLERMQVLYRLEQQMRDQGMDWEQRTALIQEKAVPVLEELGKWLDIEIMRVRPTSPLGKAIAYSRARWAGLSAYALHGQIEIDNYLNIYIMRSNRLKARFLLGLAAIFRPITSHNIHHFANSFNI